VIVHRATGLVWRFFMGAVLDAVRRGVLRGDDARIKAILAWFDAPGA
jgi:hypothetical protein